MRSFFELGVLVNLIFDIFHLFLPIEIVEACNFVYMFDKAPLVKPTLFFDVQLSKSGPVTWQFSLRDCAYVLN